MNWTRLFGWFTYLMLGFAMGMFLVSLNAHAEPETKAPSWQAECYSSGEYLSQVSLARDQGRSFADVPVHVKAHYNFLSKFAYSEFGKTFLPIENYESYFRLCTKLRGHIMHIETKMKSLMGVIQTIGNKGK